MTKPRWRTLLNSGCAGFFCSFSELMGVFFPVPRDRVRGKQAAFVRTQISAKVEEASVRPFNAARE